jgi:hypothetical protein
MANYRIYFMDETGHVFEGQNYEAEDDLSALNKATALSETHGVEVWQRSRCVAKIAKGGAAVPIDNAASSLSA